MGPIWWDGTPFWEVMVNLAEPNPWALPETVQPLLTLHDKRYSGRVGNIW